jgi:ABC-2 type transport system ATP-binding protein
MIVIEDLRKRYGEIKALDGLTLTIGKGEVFGLLGPNGAGKTTTIRILTSLSNPSSGKCSINGYDVMENPLDVKREIGVAPQHLNLDSELTGRENLDFYGRLHGMKKREREKRIEELLKFVGLKERGDDLVEGYSGGMKRRLLIARALMHRPRVLFLDEPTVGLDPQTRRRIWDTIRTLKRDNITVLLTTHYIEEAEMLCDRVGIIDKGKLIALGTPDELKRQVGRIAVELFSESIADRKFFADRAEAFEFGSKYCSKEKCDFLLREANLEDVFIELTGRRIRD